MSNAHDEGKVEAAAAVLKHTRNVAEKARLAGAIPFADMMDAEADRQEAVAAAEALAAAKP